jgi:hypothetical protein
MRWWMHRSLRFLDQHWFQSRPQFPRAFAEPRLVARIDGLGPAHGSTQGVHSTVAEFPHQRLSAACRTDPDPPDRKVHRRYPCHRGVSSRRLRNFMLFLCHFPTYDRSPFHSPHPLLVFRLRFSFHVSILAPPRVSPPLLPGVSLGFLPLPCVRLSLPRSPPT